MRHQHRFDVETRPLNEVEKQILAEFNKERKTNVAVSCLKYERHTPRTTVCIATLGVALWRIMLETDDIIGVSIRSKSDKEHPETGQEFAFQRALHDYVERMHDR